MKKKQARSGSTGRGDKGGAKETGQRWAGIKRKGSGPGETWEKLATKKNYQRISGRGHQRGKAAAVNNDCKR